ncbi:AAA family ATPase [Methylobacter sp. BlB1]|uniref:AAA family ATPase n=1 Tax=Methylobacter sp. BlB1 TaxID=2785914 RepID=UPI001893844C|nr:AAA family ATPase [Methylobacter sp. BlB1]MBF6650218.1 ATP-binding protein [Methylobacter sp. BlB1]
MHAIPENLIKRSNSEYDVNVVIGENGSGKSILLNKIAREYINSGHTVVAIATSVHDKFDIKSPYFHFFGGRQGRNMVSKIIKKSLSYVVSNNADYNRLKSLVRVLEYVGYSPRIGLKIRRFKPQNIFLLKHSEDISERDMDDLLYLLDNYREIFGIDIVVPIDLGYFMSNTSALSAILRHESVMKRLKILAEVSILLENNLGFVELKDASSGELMMISTLMHISSVIDSETVILIDEPENSLHPRWQREYIQRILDVFYYHHPKLIVATHSPLIIPTGSQQANLYSISKDKLIKVDRTTSNNEEILSDIFGVVTPENRYLSDQLINIINLYDSGKITYDDAEIKINIYRERIRDKRQTDFLNGVIKIIAKIRDSKTSKNNKEFKGE